MGLLAALLLAFLLSISKVVAVRTAMSQLAQTVRSNLSHTAMPNGRLELGSGFDFYQNGVTTLIYSRIRPCWPASSRRPSRWRRRSKMA